jgi:hypothetical protein
MRPSVFSSSQGKAVRMNINVTYTNEPLGSVKVVLFFSLLDGKSMTGESYRGRDFLYITDV